MTPKFGHLNNHNKPNNCFSIRFNIIIPKSLTETFAKVFFESSLFVAFLCYDGPTFLGPPLFTTLDMFTCRISKYLTGLMMSLWWTASKAWGGQPQLHFYWIICQQKGTLRSNKQQTSLPFSRHFPKATKQHTKVNLLRKPSRKPRKKLSSSLQHWCNPTTLEVFVQRQCFLLCS